MSERGVLRSTLIAAGSNTTIKSTPGSLYRVIVANANGGTVWVEGSKDLSAPNFNGSPNASTIAILGPFTAVPATIEFGIGFEALDISATSNARVTAIYE
jgi:hypothetical protein